MCCSSRMTLECCGQVLRLHRLRQAHSRHVSIPMAMCAWLLETLRAGWWADSAMSKPFASSSSDAGGPWRFPGLILPARPRQESPNYRTQSRWRSATPRSCAPLPASNRNPGRARPRGQDSHAQDRRRYCALPQFGATDARPACISNSTCALRNMPMCGSFILTRFYPALLRPRSRIYTGLDASYSLPGVKVGYYDYPALPMISRPFNGQLAARALLPHVRSFAPDLVFS